MSEESSAESKSQYVLAGMFLVIAILIGIQLIRTGEISKELIALETLIIGYFTTKG